MAEPLYTTCSECRRAPKSSRFPGQQAASDIRRKFDYESRRARSLSPERPSQKLEEAPNLKKRLRSESPEPARKSLKLGPKKREQQFTNLPILFIPFEGNFSNRIMGGYAKRGNQTSNIVEGTDFDPYIELGSKRIEDSDIPSTVGASSHWSVKKGEVSKHKLLATSKDNFEDKLSAKAMSNTEFYELVVKDRLEYLKLNALSTVEQGLPEVIVLSERLLAWPEQLDVIDNRYIKCFVLGQGNLQDMAAYVLESARHCYGFEVHKRDAKFSGKKFTETWLVVKKITVSPAFSVACVHLSSKYTGCRTEKMSPIMQEVLDFAREIGIHAIVGDCNMNTYGLHGGFFPVSNEFVQEGSSLALKTSVATSSGGGDKAYMGGIICDSRVSFRSTLTTFGNCAVPPWFFGSTFFDRVYSDHHSLYCNYALYESGSSGFFKSSPGGDCFFDTLLARLATLETAQALRERVIDGITANVVHDPHIVAPRSVLVQVPHSNSALPVQCASRTDFMAEMRQPGRWVDDTIITYIALFLGQPINVQYAGFYAVFASDGSREDHMGLIPFGQDGICMNCRGNHFW